MTFKRCLLMLALIASPLIGAAEELILPVFALNAQGTDDLRWSTEVYLVNPTPNPVQVAIAGLLTETVHRTGHCGQAMSQTRVVPPKSAVLWTASGLAADLGCTNEVLGALRLRSDGPVQVTGRLVHHQAAERTPPGILSGGGQPVQAIRTDELPGPATLLLPSLLWHRNPCGKSAFSTKIGLVNPGADPVVVTIFLPDEGRRVFRLNGRPVALPHQMVVEPRSWTELAVSPMDLPNGVCLEPESFDLEFIIDGPLAVYGTVLDHRSMDGRMVAPVNLELN